MLHIRSLGHAESLVQTLLHCGTCVGVGDGVGVAAGEPVGAGDGLGVGDGVEQTQLVSDTQAAFLQLPVEHVIPVGHSAVVTQALLHCGTGVDVGLGLGVLMAKDKLQIGVGVTSCAWGLLSGTLGATATSLN